MADKNKNIKTAFKNIKLLALDVDGILTDGSLHYTESGEIRKSFNAHDGMGIMKLIERGFPVAMITLDYSKAALYRAKRLGVKDIYINCENKVGALEEVCKKYGIGFEDVAYMGDDLGDVKVMREVGLPITVPRSAEEIKNIAHFVTASHGGHGAVREICNLLMKSQDDNWRTVGIIPARYQSQRLPGKALLDLGGLPLIVRAYKQAEKANLDDIFIATDDKRIRETCQAHGCKVIMTSADHVCGTERCAEAIKDLSADFIINIQGDEAFIAPELIDAIAQEFRSNPTLEMISARCRLDDPDKISDSNTVKLVCNSDNQALYFSRSPIPFGSPDAFYKHIGIYGYKRSTLEQLAALPPSTLEKAEGLEQLRALENGIDIQMIDSAKDCPSINTIDDLQKARDMLKNR